MKHPINRFINVFGLNLTRFKRSPYKHLLNIPRFSETTVDLLGHDFIVADSHSFYYSYQEIFIDEIYRFHCDKNNPMIIDCGANYGTSIMYFKSIYPYAVIKGIEADPMIYSILKKNISNHYHDINLINKALSNTKGKMQFYSEGADGGRLEYMEKPKSVFEIETVLLDDLIVGEVDFLKMDIEGAETEVLLSSNKLNLVKQMFIEYHSLLDSNQLLSQLLETLSKNKFRYYIQEIYCPEKPFQKIESMNGMDLQLNIFAIRNAE